MAYCKKFIVLFLILFILLFNFSSVFASDVESVEISRVTGIKYSPNTNYFINDSSALVDYFTVESGYIYTITNNSPSVRFFGSCDSVPAYQVDYNLITSIESGESYSFIVNNSNLNYYFYSWGGDSISVTREKIVGQESAIDDLVNNVGPNALWGVFGSGIDFVFVIVIVAFGLFIIYKLISGLSKGKSKV